MSPYAAHHAPIDRAPNVHGNADPDVMALAYRFNGRNHLMSAFSGKQGKGAARRHADRLRAEAEARNAATPHNRTRQHRLGLCSCDSFGGAA